MKTTFTPGNCIAPKNAVRFSKTILSVFLVSLICDASFAGAAYNLGKVQTFMSTYTQARESERSNLPLRVSTERSFTVKVNINTSMVDHYNVIGTVNGHTTASSFFFQGEGNEMKGKIILYDTKEAFDIYTNAQGETFVQEIDINKVVCLDMPLLKDEEQQDRKGTPSVNVPQPQDMESNPGAPGCLYIDFDGEYVSGSTWNGGTPIDAQPANFTETQMRNCWKAVVEDFLPFQINVTTNRAVYDSYPNNRKNMNIATTTNWRGSGGVAYVNSWSDTKAEPSWAFNLGDKSVYMTVSHEVGHTLGLNHDGTSSSGYYSGHGDWGPIMGAPFTKNKVHWARNEYSGANNSEDDLAIITKTANGTPYRVDDHANAFGASATTINADATGTLSTTLNNGIIMSRTDKDVFKFAAGVGPATFTFTNGPRYPDLDMQIRLLNSAGTEVMLVNPEPALNATLLTNIATAGTYYLEIDGVGYGVPLNTGYSDYGSLGYFLITGKFVPLSTSVAEINDVNSRLFVYPNPGNGLFTFKVNQTSGDIQAEVYNALGQIVHTKKVTAQDETMLDLAALPKGIYHLKVITDEGSISQRIIKQ